APLFEIVETNVNEFAWIAPVHYPASARSSPGQRRARPTYSESRRVPHDSRACGLAGRDGPPVRSKPAPSRTEKTRPDRARSCSLRSDPREATINGWPLMTFAIESVMVGNHVTRIFD